MSENPSEISDAPDVELPGTAGQVAKEKPELWRAFQALGAATGAAGPLSEREQRLVNLALALGGDSEGATHSHAAARLPKGCRRRARACRVPRDHHARLAAGDPRPHLDPRRHPGKKAPARKGAAGLLARPGSDRQVRTWDRRRTVRASASPLRRRDDLDQFVVFSRR